MLATAQVVKVADPETSEPAAPIDATTAACPGVAAVKLTGLVAVVVAPLVCSVATCAGETAQLTFPIVLLGTWHGTLADPIRLQVAGSLLKAWAVNMPILGVVLGVPFWEKQPLGLPGPGVGLPGSGMILTLSTCS